MRRLLCYFRPHKWDRTLDQVPPKTMFYRINCTRCGMAVDGAALRRIRDSHPGLAEYVRFYLP